MMLPEHLDYEEVSGSDGHGGRDWWLQVHCRADGCWWTFDASWSDLADDGDVDWNAEHPRHA